MNKNEFVIGEELLQAVVNILAVRPYAEVYRVLPNLQGLPELNGLLEAREKSKELSEVETIISEHKKTLDKQLKENKKVEETKKEGE
jgi:hypothetical protein